MLEHLFGVLEHTDQQITLAINSLNCPLTDHIWGFLSNQTVWYPFYALILGLFVWRLGWKRALAALGAIVLTIVACDQLSNLVKDTACRLRPSSDPDIIAQGLNIVERPSKSFSFFSAHAANAMGLAASANVSFHRLRRMGHTLWFGVVMYIWAFLVSVSRIFVGKHFFGDVLVGMIVGLSVGFMLGYVVYRLVKRFKVN